MSLHLRDNRRTAILLSSVIVAMLGLSAASVPLYRLFCSATGLGGTTQRAAVAPGAAATDQRFTIEFNADLQPGMPWRFAPAQHAMSVAPGEERLAFYEAENRSGQPIVGRAVYNVSPHKAGPYFAKLACFCFEEQTLEAGERVDMPVSFFVDPALLDDVSAAEVRKITLSYTFYIDAEATAALRRARALAG